MSRSRSVFACSECGAQQPRWLGRCPSCEGWDTLVEETVGPAAAIGATPGGPQGAGSGPGSARALREIAAAGLPRLESGIAELDRVLGGGLVPGSVVLLGGEPGVGKSTLALQLAAELAPAAGRDSKPGSVLYVSGEESPEQIRLRADRLKSAADCIFVMAESSVEALVGPWIDLSPRLVIVDSIQTLRSERVESVPGSVAQVRESAARLSALAKQSSAVLLLVGHVTKEGLIAGPRVLEHMVDVVLNFEGDRDHAFRLLRASKNRFGSTHEVGVFTMGVAGLEGVPNPSELFLAERRAGTPGSCVVPVTEGTRPMLVEIQGLVAPATYGTPRRTAIGIEDSRLALLLAVLDRRSDIDLLSRDVYVNAAGGVRVTEPAADLGLALAIASSRLDRPVPSDVAACGEVGLGGEVRRVPRIEARLREAARLGFRRVLVPSGLARPTDCDCELVEISEVGEAVAWLRASTPGHEVVN